MTTELHLTYLCVAPTSGPLPCGPVGVVRGFPPPPRSHQPVQPVPRDQSAYLVPKTGIACTSLACSVRAMPPPVDTSPTTHSHTQVRSRVLRRVLAGLGPLPEYAGHPDGVCVCARGRLGCCGARWAFGQNIHCSFHPSPPSTTVTLTCSQQSCWWFPINLNLTVRPHNTGTLPHADG